METYQPPMTGEDLLAFIAEYMNLVDACVQKGVVFERVDGMSLDEHREFISNALEDLGYSKTTIEKMWTGEVQLTSS